MSLTYDTPTFELIAERLVVSVPVIGRTGASGSLHVGFTGCRKTLPHMQRLAVYAGEALQPRA